MPFKQVSSILVDAKDSYCNNPYELFQLLIDYTGGFDPNTEFLRPTHVVCVEKRLHNHSNRVLQYNKKQKYHKCLNNVLTKSRNE